jgi:glycine/D-amino acid oxidase-like deaminating enzyme
MARVTVIGAGVAGLTAALYATTAGHRVVVVDRTARLGGRATSEQVNGIPFGFGPHLMLNNGPLAKVVKKISRLKMVTAPLRIDRIHVPGAGMLRPRDDVRTAAARRSALRADRRDEPVVQAARLLSGMGCPEGSDERTRALLKQRLNTIGEGWAGVVGRMAAALDEVGVLIEPSSEVVSIEGRTVLLSDGRRFESDAIVVACGWRRARTLLEPMMKDALPHLVPLKASTLDVQITSQPLGERHAVVDVERHGVVLDLAGIQRRMGVEGSLLSAAAFERADETTDERAQRLMAMMDAHALGWRERTVEQRLQRSITVQTSGDKPTFDALASQGVLLAGEWVDSPHHLSDAAAFTGRLAGRHVDRALP